MLWIFGRGGLAIYGNLNELDRTTIGNRLIPKLKRNGPLIAITKVASDA